MFCHSNPLTRSIFQNWLKDKVTFTLKRLESVCLLNCSETFYLVRKNLYLVKTFSRTSLYNRHHFLVPIAHFPYERKEIIEKLFFWKKTYLRSFKHYVKDSNFTKNSWCGKFLERYSFHKISGESPETLRKLCLSPKFPHKELRWKFDIFRSESYCRRKFHQML